jgi:hypothetical protein
MDTIALEAVVGRAVTLEDGHTEAGLFQTLGQARPTQTTPDNQDMERRCWHLEPP